MLHNFLEYYNYLGSVEVDLKNGYFFGTVQGIKTPLRYTGKTVEELVHNFHAVVDEYFEQCEHLRSAPESAYEKSFEICLPDREIHLRMAKYAMNHNTSVNSFVVQAINEKIAKLEKLGEM